MSKPLIHFAHANGIPAYTYNKLFDVWRSDAKLIAIPKLGHNPLYPVTNAWPLLVDELIAYLEAHSSRPVIGIGHSLGATLTFMTAYRRSDLFEQVILMDPPLLAGVDAYIYRFLKKIGKAQYVSLAAKSAGRTQTWPSREQAWAYFKSKKLFRSFDPQCLKDYIDSATEPYQGGLRLAYKVDVEVDIFNTLPDDIARWDAGAYKVPTHLIVGKKSTVTLSKYVRPFLKRFSNIVCTSIPEGHMFPLEKPTETAYRIRELYLKTNKICIE